MAESEATVRGTSDGGQGTGAHMVGGSLPPRKRLLAGLKQNGLWLASSSPASATGVHRPGGGRTLGTGTVSSLRSSSEVLTEKSKEGCMNCGVLESDLWRKGKRNGGVERLCDFCNLPFNKNSNCPHCQGGFADGKDSAVWLECTRCLRFVHVGCEQKIPPLVDGASYVCPDCFNFKKDEEDVNACLRTGALTGRPCPTSGVEGNFALPAAAEGSIPCNKKPRVSREPRSKSNSGVPDDGGAFEEVLNRTKVLSGRKGSRSKEVAAAAAAGAAALAGRVAAAAKASAAAKAATAVRAAAIAKAALDAAALAAQVEAQVRAEFRKNSVSLERSSVRDVNVDAALCQLRKGRAEETVVKTEMKAAGVEIATVTNVPSIDDEELARQLHRAINSSPRISSGLTPLRRKPSTKPLPLVNTPHAVTSWPRLGLSTDSEPPLQTKQQQTKPRSLQLKEGKLFDSLEVKLESKPFGGTIRTKIQQRHCTMPSGNATDPLNFKDCEKLLLQDETIAPLNVAYDVENERIDGHPAVLSCPEDSQDRILSATDVSQAAALLDEVLISEADEDEAFQEEHLSSLHNRTGVHRKQDVDASTTMTIEANASHIDRRLSEEESRESTEAGGGTATTNMSGVAALVQVASSAMALLENRDTSSTAAFVDGAWSIGGDDDSLEDSAGENLGQLTVKSSLAILGVSLKACSDFESPSAHKSFPQPSIAGNKCEQVTLKGRPRCWQVFASGVRTGSCPAALRICAPHPISGSTIKYYRLSFTASSRFFLFVNVVFVCCRILSSPLLQVVLSLRVWFLYFLD